MCHGTASISLIYRVARQTEEKRGCTAPPGKAYRVPGQVDTLESVHEGEPDCVTPSQVESKVVMSDVDCAQVPRLVEEEVYDVRSVQNIKENRRVTDEAEVVVLLGGERQVYQRPSDNC